MTQKIWPKNSIVYYTGETSEYWSPNSLKTGLGGSQTAVIYLSKIWKSLGYEVTVYSNIGQHEGIYEGITYYDYKKFNPQDKYNILILWREPSFVDMNLSASLLILDLHDTPQQEEYTQNRLDKIDRIFVKSEFQRNLLPLIPEEKFVIIPNGADVKFASTNHVNRDPKKLIYASSYYRGLEYMLTYGWPILKKELPDITLDIYYGWDLFNAVYSNDIEKQKWKAKMIDLMNQPGITEYGRVGIETLIEANHKANILYYGCTMLEIDCITVRQAAMAGCIPFTTNWAALSEKDYSIKVDGNPFDQNTQQKLAYTIIDFIKNNNLPQIYNQKDKNSLRNVFIKSAMQESWDIIAKKWTSYF